MYYWTPIYLNRQDVLKAIHVDSIYNLNNRIWPNPPNDWYYEKNTQDMALLFPYFFKQRPNWKISIISGDADPDGNCIAMQRWIKCLNKPLVKDWFNWMMNKDVAGSVIIYKGITYQSVKHCGHMIATYCNQAGFEFFHQFVQGIYNSQ